MAAVLEDRSDTWSVDAIASDSEADPTNRNEDLLMIDDGGSESGKSSSVYIRQLSLIAIL